MKTIEGIMLHGNYDESDQEFTLKRIKNIYTETSLNESQLENLYAYLKAHEHDQDGQIVSFYDQLLLKLTPDEIKILVAELENVLSMYE